MKAFSPRVWILITFLILSLSVIFPAVNFAQDNPEAVKQYASSVQDVSEGLTMWQLIRAGGIIMIVLLVLSIVTMYLVFYNFQTIDEEKLMPSELAAEVLKNIEKRKTSTLEEITSAKDNIIASIVNAGLKKRTKEYLVNREAMENQARREMAKLWQNVGYLADIATVAPLIGLLGTVLGMIQAFNVIAFQTAVVKPILLAGGVSKAMVTTAAGLIVAIPTYFFYAYFKGKVSVISAGIETFTSDVLRILES